MNDITIYDSFNLQTNTHINMSSRKRYPKMYTCITNRDHYVTYRSSVHLRPIRNELKDSVLFTDTELKEILENNHKEIIKMYNNCEYHKIRELLNNLRGYSFYSDSYYCFVILFEWCMTLNDMELFEIIVQQNKLDSERISKIYPLLITHANPIPFLRILLENDVNINPKTIYLAIAQNNIKFISCLIDVKYDITEGWIMYDESLKSNPEKLISISMLKLLLSDANILQLVNLQLLMTTAILMHDLSIVEFIVEFIVETYPNHDLNKYNYLNDSCEAHNKDALIYLLMHGANVHVINQDSIAVTCVEIVKILIDHNYVLSKGTLKELLMDNYVYDLNNIIYLIKIGAEIQWFFDNENEDDMLPEQDNYYYYAHSPLERMITEDFFDIIKFLAENYLTLLRPEINRLFVIACANGRNVIAKYLYDLGVKLNVKALMSAIFFGHYETVVMLLKLGMKFYFIPLFLNMGNIFTVSFMRCFERL